MSALLAGEFEGNERFQVQGRLGAGGYGVVYRALDRERNIPVALKTLRHVAPRALVRFKQEFRQLADVAHPNLVTLYELSSQDDQWFFTMELVEGVDFLWYVRGEAYPAESGPTSVVSAPTGPELRAVFDEGLDDVEPAGASAPGAVDLDRLRHALPQLAEGVRALHGAGKLHRDIKPSNVMVTREGRVVLLDFGLVAEIAPAHTHTVDAVGTPAYMSPEQVAGLPLNEASDWYNVGALLFQSLTGQLPFTGPAPEVMRRKQQAEPPRPREVAAGVPADLDDLCWRLLRRDPAQRPSGADVLKALTRTVAAAPPAPPSPSGASLFVGREQHLDVLRGAYEALKSGQGLTVVVHGGSGMGKTALVRRFLDEVRGRDPDTVVLAGRCYERESVPYKALDALVDTLSRYLRRLPSAQAEAFLPHDILALARVFPVLRQVEAVNRARRAVLDIPDSLELRRRAFAALRELLVRVADRRPLVLFVDDLQWGDADSAALLEDLLRPPDPPVLLAIGCYRSEEAETSPLLQVLLPKRRAESRLPSRDILVGELSASESQQLALALVAGEPEGRRAHAETIAREAGGNPYFIEELARSGPSAAEVSFDRVLETRVARLPEGARRLLELVAVSGAPLDLGVAYRAAGLEREGDGALVALRAGHLVRTRRALGRQEIETYHDRIRDAVASRLTPEALKDCHRRLVSALLASGRADPEALAMHYLAAGEAASAAEYAGAAAAKAAEGLAFDRAASLYRFALQLGAAPPAERARLEVQLGEALANAGRGAEAAQAYLSAALAAGPVLSVELHRRAAWQFYVSGHMEDGARVLRGVLDKLGLQMPATAQAALLWLLVRRLRIRLRGLAFQEKHESEVRSQDLLRIDTCWAVGVGVATLDMVRGADFQARHLLLALRAGEPYRIARALAIEGCYVAMRGNKSLRRAGRLIEASRTLAERVKHPYALGLATLAAGCAAWLDGRWRESRSLSERAEQILRERCTGVDWEILIAQLFGLASLFFLGDLATLSRRLPPLLEEAEGRNNLLRATVLRVGFFSHVPWLAADDPARALQEMEDGLSGWRRGQFDYLQLWVRAARTEIALYRGEPPAASAPVPKPWRAFARALDRFVQVGYIRGLDTRARLRLGTAAHVEDARERHALVDGVERHARAILRERTRWGDPLAWILRAGAAATAGDAERALRSLEAAEAGFTTAEMALHAAAARRRRGELVGGDVGRDLVASVDAWMAGQNVRNPERMTAMLAPGRWR